MSWRGGVVVVVAGGHVGVGVAPLVLHPGPRVALRPVLGPETSAVIAQHYILQVEKYEKPSMLHSTYRLYGS